MMHTLLSIGHTIVANAFALGVVIFLHEYGHFFACRRLGVRVEKFAFGFGPEIIGFTGRSGTRFALCAIPFGGFVKPAGEDPSTVDAAEPFPNTQETSPRSRRKWRSSTRPGRWVRRSRSTARRS